MFALDPLLSRVLAICVALVFASAAWHKLRDRDLFAMQLHAYRILPGRALVLGHALAPLEAAAAVAVLAWLVLLAAINQVLRQGRTMRGTAH